MPTCSHCSNPLADNVAFCSACGRPAPSASQLPTIDSDDPRQSPAKRSPSSRSHSSEHGSFVPGAILANRFRIVSLIGRGGMGEVYRADDLELGQPVALKFLPKGSLGDPEALERFRGEVRHARQIAHPNVCRVYDIGEHEGRTFLSMEYVDGEDLTSLLRRIGRLPSAKANEIAQQICAGLAAAHSRGILHRDLKPSNVLVDGRGQAHITDFGLAVRANEDLGETVGTPAYMAPEQFRAETATPRTDLYSLGLVFYELYTGKRPFDGSSFAECRRQHLTEIPPPPREIVRDLEPSVEAAILRCLEKDPARRPPSALAVSAALPGGNPLAAIIAAGETPSPEMVAASGAQGVLSHSSALLLSIALLLVVAATVVFSRYAQAINLFPAAKSPEYLVDRAKDLAFSLGRVSPPADYAWWFGESADADHLLASVAGPPRYREISSIYPSLLFFGYRQSPRLLESPFRRQITQLEPAPFYSGEISLTLDLQGRLLRFSMIPPEKGEPPADAEPLPDWTAFWQAASLAPDRLTPIPAIWAPDVPADRYFAWRGELQGHSFEVHAASRVGKPIFFKVASPDQTSQRMVGVSTPGGYRFGLAVFGILGTAVIILSIYFAYRNLRSGRGDRRGALRFAGAVYLIVYLFRILTSHHVLDIGYEWYWLQATIGLAAGVPLLLAVYYLALEPFIRRTWPDLLVSWTRLLSGNFNDPLVGRDIFLGILLGSFHAMIWVGTTALPYFFSIRGWTPIFISTTLGSTPEFLGNALQTFADATINSMGALSVMFLLGKLTHRKWIVAIAVAVLWGILNVPGYNYALEIPLALVAGVIASFTVARLGLLALVFLFAANQALQFMPFSFDFNRWYAPRGIFVLALFLALAFYGLRTSLGSKTLLAQPD